jgi:ribosomal protein S18 acetylase RimI-like enzyme
MPTARYIDILVACPYNGPTMIIIRPFTPADQPAARQLILAGLGEHFGFIDETANPDLDDITAHYPACGAPFLVAEDVPTSILDGKGPIVGTAALVAEDASTGRIVRVSVDRALRRCGLGRTLLDALIVCAQQRGMTALLVETNHDWADAVGFYRGQGFVPYDQDDVSIYMRRELSAG